jgi:hypothetical protein
MIFSGGIVFVVRSDAWVDINNELEIRKIVLLYFINKLSLLVARIDLADTSLESTDLNNASRAVTLRLFQTSTVGANEEGGRASRPPNAAWYRG